MAMMRVVLDPKRRPVSKDVLGRNIQRTAFEVDEADLEFQPYGLWVRERADATKNQPQGRYFFPWESIGFILEVPNVE